MVPKPKDMMKAKAKAMSVKETTASTVVHTKFWPDKHSGPYVNWVLQDLIHSDGWVKEIWKGTLKTAKAKKAKTVMKFKTAMKPMKADEGHEGHECHEGQVSEVIRNAGTCPQQQQSSPCARTSIFKKDCLLASAFLTVQHPLPLPTSLLAYHYLYLPT